MAIHPSPLRRPGFYLTSSLIAVRERMSVFGVPGEGPAAIFPARSTTIWRVRNSR
jgi:hypothetical protein